MKECPPTVGGWIWYIKIVKSSGIDVDEELSKILMKMYTSGVTPEKAIEELKNVVDR